MARNQRESAPTDWLIAPARPRAKTRVRRGLIESVRTTLNPDKTTMKEPYEKIQLHPGIYAAIYRDEDAQNPWEGWDGNPPLLAYSRDGLTAYGEEVTPHDLVDLIPVSRFRLRAFQDSVQEACGIDPEDFARERRNWTGTPAETARNAIRELIARGWAGNCDRPGYRTGGGEAYFDCLETLAELAGVPVYRTQSRGYCQGDWADLIAFALPGDKDTRYYGADPVESLRQSCALWSDWAWGDVYGYVLENEDGEPVEGPGGGFGGSCWGFYGSNHEESGLIEDAKSAAIYLAKEAAEREALAGFVETV